MEAVYNYMKCQNRPYSAHDIVANLNKELGRTTVQKALDTLVEDGRMLEKVYGKQRIYCIKQETQQSTNELMRIDKELQAHANEIESKLQELEKEIKTYEIKANTLKSSLTLEEAKQKNEQLKVNIICLEKKFDDMMENVCATEKLNESKRTAETSLKTYSESYSKRKRLCTEVIGVISENYPGSVKELYNDIGIEPTTVS